MGHFSYTCHLSGVPITGGTKAVLLPIFPKKHWSWDNSQEKLSKHGKGHLCSNDGPNMYFDELCFPIFGEYDSYGQLEKIEHDDNTKVLEEFFGLSIEDIATVICDGRRDEYEKGGQFCDSVKILDKNNEKHMMLLKTSATWYHRDVYDKLAVADSKEYFDRLDLGVHGILEALGFKYLGKDKSKERYDKVYEKDGLKVHSDGNWLNIPKEQIYSLKDLKKYCTKNGVEINDIVITGGRYSQIYEFILPYVDNLNSYLGDDHIRDIAHMLLGDEHSINMSAMSAYSFLLRKNLITSDVMEKEMEKAYNSNLTLFYFKKIKEIGNGFLKKNIIEWFNVKQYYYPTGRFLYPVGTSAQDGDFHKVKILLQTALDVTNESLKYYDEYDEDDDE